MIEPGIYRAGATGGVLGETKNGKEQIAVVFELLDRPGQQITYFGYFSEKAVEHTFRALRTAGFKGGDLSDLSSLSGETPDVMLTVEHEEYEGKTYAKVRWVNSTSGPVVQTQLADQKVKSLAARMKGQLAAFDKKEGMPKQNGSPLAAAKKKHSVPPEPPPIADDPSQYPDDTPF